MNTPQHHPSSHPRPRSCPRGDHRWTRTFRPSEALCLSCSMVTYCPACFLEQHLAPAARSYPLECQSHHGYVYHKAQPLRNEAHP